MTITYQTGASDSGGTTTTIDVPTVRAGLTSARKELSQQEDYLKKASDEIDFMDSAWDSESQRVYTDRFRSAKMEMDNFNNSIKEYLQSMERFVDDCVATDASIASALRNVSW